MNHLALISFDADQGIEAYDQEVRLMIVQCGVEIVWGPPGCSVVWKSCGDPQGAVWCGNHVGTPRVQCGVEIMWGTPRVQCATRKALCTFCHGAGGYHFMTSTILLAGACRSLTRRLLKFGINSWALCSSVALPNCFCTQILPSCLAQSPLASFPGLLCVAWERG